ncbi:MAG: MFS transporter, partial [Comamonadaceae bacterium]
SIALAICAIAAVSAWTARETSRVHMNDLGDKHAVPVPEAEYLRLREQALAGATR